MGEEKLQRRPRKKSKGKLFGCFFVILVIAAGVTVAFRPEAESLRNWIKGLFGEENVALTDDSDRDINTPDVKAPESDLELDDKNKRKDDDLPDRMDLDTPGKTQYDESDDGLAKKYLTNSAEKFNGYNFERSSEYADQVLSLNCDGKYKDKAREIKEKCRVLVELTKDLKISPLADLSKVKKITLPNNSVLQGRVLSDSGDSITFEGEGNMRMTFKKSEILKYESVKPEDERAKLIGYFDEKYSSAKKEKNPLKLYRAGIYGLEYKFNKQGYRALLEAYELAKGKKRGIIGLVEEDKARGLLAHAIWYEDSGNIKMAKARMQECIREYPETEAAAKARRYFDYVVARVEKNPEPAQSTAPVNTPSGPEPEKPAADEFKPVTHSSAAQGKLADADKLYMDGVKCMQLALKNRPSHESNINFKKAEDFFRKALAIYEPIYNKTKDAALDIKMMKINEQLYSSLKLRTAH